jgi:hypothetical protein
MRNPVKVVDQIQKSCDWPHIFSYRYGMEKAQLKPLNDDNILPK